MPYEVPAQFLADWAIARVPQQKRARASAEAPATSADEGLLLCSLQQTQAQRLWHSMRHEMALPA